MFLFLRTILLLQIFLSDENVSQYKQQRKTRYSNGLLRALGALQPFRLRFASKIKCIYAVNKNWMFSTTYSYKLHCRSHKLIHFRNRCRIYLSIWVLPAKQFESCPLSRKRCRQDTACTLKINYLKKIPKLSIGWFVRKNPNFFVF